jgi:hypothetical protein
LPIQPQKSAFLWKVVGRQIPTNGGEPLAQFFPIAPVPAVAETAEPLITVRLRNCCPRSDNLPTLAPSVARRADVTPPAKGRRKLIGLG